MKTNSRNLNPRLWLVTAASSMVFLLAGTASAQWSTSGTNVYYNGGNVGIGTDSPGTLNGNSPMNAGAKLQITGPATDYYTAGLILNGYDYSQLVLSSQRGFINQRLFSITQQANRLDFSNQNDAGGGSTNIMTMLNSGNVGLGTTSPNAKLEVASGASNPFYFNGTYNKLKADLGFTEIESFHGTRIVIDSTNSYSDRYFSISHGASFISGGSPTELFRVQENGNVGIGTASPIYKLDVNGSTRVTGNITLTASATEPGNITLSGTINAKYQDVAEWVPSSEHLPTGTVVVLDSSKSNQVIASTQSYDTSVAGVISERPGLALGETGANKVLVATTGRVLVKVDASNGPIHIGDLLVTSDIPGLAMKSEPLTIGNRKMHMPGTLIGKALEPLEKGSGKILVLLSLQ